MPAEGPAVSAGARRGGDERAGRNPETPTAAARACCRTSPCRTSLLRRGDFARARVPTSFRRHPGAGSGARGRSRRRRVDGDRALRRVEHERRDCSRRRGGGGVLARGLGPELASRPPGDRGDRCGGRRGDHSRCGGAGTGSETEDATRERLRVTDERSGAAEPAPASAPAAAAPAAGGPFGGEPRDDDAAFFARLDAAPPAPAAVEYPAASNAFFENAETAPEAGDAFSEYPPRPQTTHEYPAPQQYQQSQRPAPYSAALGGAQPYSQPAAAAFYDPGAGATAASQQGSQYGGGSQQGSQYGGGSQQGSQYGGGSQQGSVPASPAWGATAARRVLQPRRPRRRRRRRRIRGGGAGAGVSGGGVAGAVSAAAATAPVGRVGYGGLRRAVGVRATAAMARGDVIEASSIGHYVSRLS